jgi:single-stranded-DNA-specific exonuclease
LTNRHFYDIIIIDKNGLFYIEGEHMLIKKRRNECKTIEDVVLANTKLSKEDFFNSEKEYIIKDLDTAANILKDAGNHNEMITVVGDYDADGICASSILSIVFKELGWRHTVRLPKRFTEGYGLSESIVDEINDGILLTVDNGITAFDAIEKAKNKGLTVIVTDHHLPDADINIPNADVVIDPNALPNTATFNGYCGAGIAYKLSIELLGKKHYLIPKLKSLAAIATVADVMPLIEENRFIVKDGLKTMLTKEGQTSGLRAILGECKQEKYFSAKNIAFKLAPMINAPGRLHDNGAETSFNALIHEGDYISSSEKAAELTEINNVRKSLKDKYLKILIKKIKENNMENDRPLIIYEENLHEGLVGILAGQLAEEFSTPTFVFTNGEEENIAKGSGRTYGDVHLKSILDKYSWVVEKYGGHAEAAGVSIKLENINTLREVLSNELSGTQVETDDTLYFDLKIDAKQIGLALKNLELYEPFGQGNPEIVFYIKNYIVTESKYLQDGKTVKFNNAESEAIGFGLGQTYKEMGEPKIVDIIGVLNKNCFMNSVKNQIEIIKFFKPISQPTQTKMAQELAELAKKRNNI